MANLTGVVYTADGLGVLPQAAISAYTVTSQATPPLVDQDGNALAPKGSPAANTTSDATGAFQLTGLTAATPYHLYVVPSAAQSPGAVPYWLYWRMPDVVPSTRPCVLYGADETAQLWPAGTVVQAVLEQEGVIAGGIVVTAQPIQAVVSPNGTFALSLWPTSALSPQALYRVSIGSSTWRGSIPVQASISFDAWIALPTTVRLS